MATTTGRASLPALSSSKVGFVHPLPLIRGCTADGLVEERTERAPTVSFVDLCRTVHPRPGLREDVEVCVPADRGPGKPWHRGPAPSSRRPPSPPPVGPDRVRPLLDAEEELESRLVALAAVGCTKGQPDRPRVQAPDPQRPRATTSGRRPWRARSAAVKGNLHGGRPKVIIFAARRGRRMGEEPRFTAHGGVSGRVRRIPHAACGRHVPRHHLTPGPRKRSGVLLPAPVR